MPKKLAIFNSDQGVQFTSEVFTNLENLSQNRTCPTPTSSNDNRLTFEDCCFGRCVKHRRYLTGF